MLSYRSGILLVIGALVVLATVTAPAQDAAVQISPIHSPSAATGSAARPPATDESEALEAAPLAAGDAEVDPAAPHAHAATGFDHGDTLIIGLTVFVLAVFVGFEVITKVPTTLHTPLMSGSNAISGITVVGAIIVGGYSLGSFSSFVGCLAVALAMINVVGGFLVTHRMLSMFKRK